MNRPIQNYLMFDSVKIRSNFIYLLNELNLGSHIPTVRETHYQLQPLKTTRAFWGNLRNYPVKNT